jgi:hypothetical protein
MNLTFKIGAVFSCLLAALLITWVVWEVSVDGKAFRCSDEGTLSLGFWTSAETHKSAGDRIQPGWTWERVSRVNALYKLGFLALWIGGSVVALRLHGAARPA